MWLPAYRSAGWTCEVCSAGKVRPRVASCAVLCCAVLCCAVLLLLCCAVLLLCCAVLLLLLLCCVAAAVLWRVAEACARGAQIRAEQSTGRNGVRPLQTWAARCWRALTCEERTWRAVVCSRCACRAALST